MIKIKRTEGQISRAQRNKEIIRKYAVLKRKYPELSRERLYSTIAEDYSISSGAIRAICEKEAQAENYADREN